MFAALDSDKGHHGPVVKAPKEEAPKPAANPAAAAPAAKPAAAPAAASAAKPKGACVRMRQGSTTHAFSPFPSFFLTSSLPFLPVSQPQPLDIANH